MAKYYNLTVWYKHNVSTGFFREDYNLITEDTLNRIIKRYNEKYKNSDYVALQIEFIMLQ